MPRIEEVHGGGVLAFDEPDLQVSEESGRRHPEVVAYHDDGLDAPTVRLAQGGQQFGVLHPSSGVQPLLELVQHDRHLPARGDRLAFTKDSQ